MSLVGEKVILRYPKITDTKWLFENITNPKVKDTVSNPFLEGLTYEQELKWVKSQPRKRRKKEEINWAIIDKPSGNLVGACGFNTIKKNDNYGEVGYWIAPKYWGKGYATDAVKLLLKYGFKVLKLNRVESRTLTFNIGSIRAQEKVGLKREGLLRERCSYKGKPHDEYLTAILKSEWEEKCQQ